MGGTIVGEVDQTLPGNPRLLALHLCLFHLAKGEKDRPAHRWK